MSRLRHPRVAFLPLVLVVSLLLGCAPSVPPTPTPAPPKPAPTAAPAKPAPTAAPAKPAPTAAPAKPAAPTAAPTVAPKPAAPAPTQAPPAKAAEDVTMRFSISASGVNAAYYLALEKGYFREAGLNVKLLDGTGSAQTAQVVGNGSDTFGAADAGTIASFVGQGLPIKMVATVIQRNPMGIVSLAETGITKPKDLEGKKLGQSPESAATVIFPAFAAANGIDVNKIDQVYMAIPATLAALPEKKIHATTGFLTSAVVPLEARGIKLNVLRYADLGVNTLGVGMFTSNAVIQQKPDMVRRFVAAALKGWDDATKNPGEAIQAFMKTNPQANQQVARGQLQIYLDGLHTQRTQSKRVGFGDTQDWEDTIGVLLKAGMLKERKAADQYFTNDFLPK